MYAARDILASLGGPLKITFDAKHTAVMGRGIYTTGDEVDFPLKDVQPLLDRELAHEGWDSEKPKRAKKKKAAKDSGDK